MHEILRNLPRGARVLDLGCAGGSFSVEGPPFRVVRADLDRPQQPPANFVQADAAKLPFASASFDAIVSNHSLEHFENLTESLAEIARTVQPKGAFYVAIPDASTLSDRLYRWLARGGGHVNAFTSATELARRIESATGMRHIGTRTLCASLSCFNRKNRRTRAPRRLILIGGGTETSLRFLTYGLRLADRLFGSRLSVYGWALYFGEMETPIDTRPATNVCIRCGSGHPSGWLLETQQVQRGLLVRRYKCPTCRSVNFFTDDKHYAHLADA